MQPVTELTQQLVIHGTVEFLAVAGDKGNGGALIQEGDHILYMLRGAPQLPGQRFKNGIHSSLLGERKISISVAEKSGKVQGISCGAGEGGI